MADYEQVSTNDDSIQILELGDVGQELRVRRVDDDCLPFVKMSIFILIGLLLYLIYSIVLDSYRFNYSPEYDSCKELFCVQLDLNEINNITRIHCERWLVKYRRSSMLC